MNQKRSWPGVPNRYSTRWVPMVSLPKSIATVVVVLLPTPVRSSRPTLARVRVSSVCSGRTSLIAPTSVVLPAPKPPAMRTLNAARGTSAGPSEGTEPMQYLLQQGGTGLLAYGPLWDYGDPALHDEVGKQNADDGERQRGGGGHVGHRRLPSAQPDDPAVLGGQARRIIELLSPPGGDDDRDQVQYHVAGRLRPAPGQRVWADDRARVPVDPLVACGHAGLTPLGSARRGTSGVPPGAVRRASPASPSRRP